MDWKQIKSEAKEKINGKLWDIWKPYLIIMVISSIISVIATKIFGENSVTGETVVSLFSLLLVPAEVGYISYILKLVRGQDYDISELKVFYDKIGILIIINILMFVFIALGLIALIIPGIILAISYTMSFYIFADNKEIGAKECLDKSRELINGYKLNFFGFSLSFIGWVLLCIFVIPIIWVIPYVTTAQALYYEELKKIKSEEI